MKRRHEKEKGFTLVELIVVLVIMGILSAAIVPMVSGYVGDARTRVDESNTSMVADAARLYIMDLEAAGQATPSSDFDATVLVTNGYLTKMDEEAAGNYIISVQTDANNRLNEISVKQKAAEQETE